MNKRFFLIAVAAFGLAAISKAQCNSTFGFFTIETTSKNLCFVDTIGNVSIIGPTNLPNTTVGYHSMDFDKNGNLWFLFSDTLYLINQSNGKAQPTQKINIINQPNGQYLGLSFNNSNTPYIHFEVSSSPSGNLYSLDNIYLANATSLPNSTGISSMFGIEFDDQNNLWSMDECCINKLYQLNLTTGQAIPNTFQSFNLNGSPADLDYSNSTLYGLAFSTNTTQFFEVNTANGVNTSLFTLNGIYMGLAGGYLNELVTYDTITTYVSVTDTLIINTSLGLPAPNNQNSILIYPNPASTHITIDYGNFALMNGYQLSIENSLGQQVFLTSISQQSDYLSLATWGGNGLYYVHIIDTQGNTIDIRKIVLQ
jgi:hypothetical protein